MILKDSCRQVLEKSVFVDTSGGPKVGNTFSVVSGWCATSVLDTFATKLAAIKELHGWDKPVHFCDLRGSGGAAGKVARDWIQLFFKQSPLLFKASVWALRCEEFDLSYYGGSESTALNSIVQKNLLSVLSRVRRQAEAVKLEVCLDGPASALDPRHGLSSYLESKLPTECTRRTQSQPRIEEITVRCVEKVSSTTDQVRYPNRLCLELIDVLCGSLQRAMSNEPRHGHIKNELARNICELFNNPSNSESAMELVEVCLPDSFCRVKKVSRSQEFKIDTKDSNR